MQQQLFLLIIFLKFLLIKSEKWQSPDGQIRLDFYYSSRKPLEAKNISIITRQVQKADVKNYYMLIGDIINDRIFVVQKIHCMLSSYNSAYYGMNFESIFLFILVLNSYIYLKVRIYYWQMHFYQKIMY